MATKEIWRTATLRSEPTNYQVSNLGRVRHAKQKQIHSCALTRHGYRITKLYHGSKYHTVRVVRLVADAFLPDPKANQQIDHKNGDKTDDRVKNLEYVTQSTNIRRRYQLNGKDASTPPHYYCEKTHAKIMQLWQTGKYSQVTIGKKLGISNSTVSRIVRGLTSSRRVRPDLQVTAQPVDVEVWKPKLTPDQVLQIYHADGTLRQIGAKFGVGSMTVNNIKQKRTHRETLKGA